MPDDISTVIQEWTARLDEQERLARVATQGNWEWSEYGLHVLTEWRTCECFCTFLPDAKSSRGVPSKPGHQHRHPEHSVISAIGYDDPSVDVSDADAEHIAFNDPKTVLEDIAAKRAVIEQYREVDRVAGNVQLHPEARQGAVERRHALEQAIRAVAVRGHPAERRDIGEPGGSR